mgnify:CR=1 FL=1|jgi:hypothetical protein
MTPPSLDQATTCLVNTSALALWSGMGATVAYQATRFPTPFTDSLNEKQKQLHTESAATRRSFFCKALLASSIAVGAVGLRTLNWKAHS